MEEEQIRVDKGEVSKAAPLEFVEKLQKDNVVPPSMNNIFNPPPDLAAKIDTSNTNGNAENHNNHHDNNIESRAAGDVDYESDEGVEMRHSDDMDMVHQLQQPSIISEELKLNAVAPTEEEVDAALAGFDDIPDGNCEPGDVDDLDDDEEDEGWNYYKGSQDKLKQDEMPESYDKVDPPSAFGQNEEEDFAPTIPMETINQMAQPDLVTCIQTDSPPSPTSQGSPNAPSSPRIVEGFVTSVDLNTPEENFGSSFPINPQEETFNGLTHTDNSSGPFSVYVSNSPEPYSIEMPPTVSDAFQSPAMDFGADFSENRGSQEVPPIDLDSVSQEETSQGEQTSSVEIVHAQSMVEVVTPISSPPPSEGRPDTPPGSEFPLIMTQSMTGDQLPEVPYQVDDSDILSPQQAVNLLADIVPEVMSPDVISPLVIEDHSSSSQFDELQENPLDAPEMKPFVHFDGSSNSEVLEVIPELETVTVPLIASELHNLSLESPVNEFNILDALPVEVKTSSGFNIDLGAVIEIDLPPIELSDYAVECDPREFIPLQPTPIESPGKENIFQELPTESESYNFTNDSESADFVPEPSTPRIEDLEQFARDQLNDIVAEPTGPATFIQEPILPIELTQESNLPLESALKLDDIPLPNGPSPSFESNDMPQQSMLPQEEESANSMDVSSGICSEVLMHEPPSQTIPSVEPLIEGLSNVQLENAAPMDVTLEPAKVSEDVDVPISTEEKEKVSPSKPLTAEQVHTATPAARATKSAPKPSPRSFATAKAPATKPSTAADSKTKRAPAASSNFKVPRVSSAPPTKTRAATTTAKPTTKTTTTTSTRPSTIKPRSTSASTTKPLNRPSTTTSAASTSRPTTTKTTTTRPSTAAASTLKSRPSTTPATRTSLAPPKPTTNSAKSSPTATRANKPSTFKSTSVSTASKTTTSASSTARTSTSSATRTSTSSATRTSTTAGERVPLSARSTVTKRPTSSTSVPGVHKGPASTTAPKTNISSRTTTTAKPGVAKDAKNTTNRLLSSRTAGAPKTTGPVASKVNSRNPSATLSAKVPPKSTGLKSKTSPTKTIAAETSPAPIHSSSNGDENKICEENATSEHNTSKDQSPEDKLPEKSIDNAIENNSLNSEIIVNGEH